MKGSKIFRLLLVAVFFALVMVNLLVMPVLGATVGSISASSSSGPVGSTVFVSGTGFTPSSIVYIRFDGNNVAMNTLTTTDATGVFTSASFSVQELPRGSHSITATTSAIDTSNSLNFTITPEVTLNSTAGYVGDTAILSGKGFLASSTITIYFDDTALSQTTSTGSSGTFSSAAFTVPPAAKGTHTVRARDTTEYSPGITYTVSQKITISPTSGGVGDKMTVNGTGFAASSSVSFYWDDGVLTGESATAGTTGSFSHSNLTVPPTARGSHIIKAQDANTNAATATFTVAQKIASTPASGLPGTTVTVTGNGFATSKAITINYNNLPVITVPSPITSTGAGSFTATFSVPPGIPGTFTIEASDGTYKATSSFTTIVDAKISQATTATSPGYVGMEVTISGSGFKPSAEVIISYTPEPVELTKVTTDTTGAFSATVKIPASTGGDHTITATDKTTIKSFPFYMEKNPPPLPKPLLPLYAGKAKPLVSFDWEDVVDPSGVTYTMQISIVEDFSSIALEKKGLTKSEYTLVEAEKLPSNKTSAPYYWRLQATDSAGNESGWTTPGTFNVGFVLEFTGWMLYVALGLGAVLLLAIVFFFGFIMGRRSIAF